MYTLQLIPMGDSVGILLPEELLARFQWEAGDAIDLTETPDGYALTKHDSEVEAQLRVGRELMQEHHAVLQELAKRGRRLMLLRRIEYAGRVSAAQPGNC